MRFAPVLHALALSLPFAGAGCGTFPELDRITIADKGLTPELVPLDPLLAASPTTRATPAAADDLTARAAALRMRAATLQRQGAIDPATRARMAGGVAPPG